MYEDIPTAAAAAAAGGTHLGAQERKGRKRKRVKKVEKRAGTKRAEQALYA